MAFAPASADRGDADYVVRGVPLDATGSFRRGYARGPDRIRELSRSYEAWVPGPDVDLAETAILDAGDVDAWHDTEEVVGFASGLVADDVDAGATPVLLGGEHTVSVAGVRGTEPDVYVALDAHLDLKREHRGERYHHGCVASLVRETGADVVVVGARSGSEEEYRRAERADDVTVIAAEETTGSDAGLDAVREAVPDGATVYLSVDLDVADPGHAPGVGTPEPWGLGPATVRDAVDALAPRCVGFDVVEHVPAYDEGGATAALAAGLVRRFVAAAETV